MLITWYSNTRDRTNPVALITFSIYNLIVWDLIYSFRDSHSWRLLLNCLMGSESLITHLVCLMVIINCLELSLSLIKFIGSSIRRKHIIRSHMMWSVSNVHWWLSLVCITSEIINCDLLIYYLSWISIKVLSSMLHIAMFLLSIHLLA